MSVTVNVSEVNSLAKRFAKAGPAAVDACLKETTKIAIELVGYIKINKLHGQVLNQRSGKLSRNTTHRVNLNGSIISAHVGVYGNVPYAAIHEYGGEIKRTSSKGKEYIVNMPERSYLRTALAEKSEGYAARYLKVLKANRG